MESGSWGVVHVHLVQQAHLLAAGGVADGDVERHQTGTLVSCPPRS